MNPSPWQAALLKKVINASPLLREQHEQAHRFMKIRSHPAGNVNSEPLKEVFQHFDMEDPVALPCLQASLNSMKGVFFQVLLAVS